MRGKDIPAAVIEACHFVTLSKAAVSVATAEMTELNAGSVTSASR